MVTATGARFGAKCVIVATGTFLGGKVLIGEYARESGPDGMFAATELSKSLVRMGVEGRRAIDFLLEI